MYFNKLGHVSKKNVTSSLYMKRNRLMAQWGRLCRAQWDVLCHTLYINHGLCVLWMTLSVKWKGKARAAFRLEFTYTHTHTTETRHTLRNHTRTCRHKHALHTHTHTYTHKMPTTATSSLNLVVAVAKHSTVYFEPAFYTNLFLAKFTHNLTLFFAHIQINKRVFRFVFLLRSQELTECG